MSQIDEIKSQLYRTINFIAYKEKVQLVNYSRQKLEEDLESLFAEVIEYYGTANNIYNLSSSINENRTVGIGNHSLSFYGPTNSFVINESNGIESSFDFTSTGIVKFPSINLDAGVVNLVGLQNDGTLVYLDKSTIEGKSIYNTDSQITGTRNIQLPSASTVYWNIGPDSNSSIFELASNSVILGGNSGVATSITGQFFLNNSISEHTGPEAKRVLVYSETAPYGASWISTDDIGTDNIYTVDGQLTGDRSVISDGSYSLTMATLSKFLVITNTGALQMDNGWSFLYSSNLGNWLSLRDSNVGIGKTVVINGSESYGIGSNITIDSNYAYALSDNSTINALSDGSAIIGGTSNSITGENIILLGVESTIATQANTTYMQSLIASGTAQLSSYGAGANAGTVTYLLGVDSQGNVVETSETATSWGTITGTLSNQTDLQNALDAKLDVSLKGAVNGLAELDGSGRMPASQLPTSAMEYKGVWDANTNTPSLSSGVGTNGDYWLVSAAGSTNLDGESTWEIGDVAIFNGSLGQWQRVGRNDLVSSVFGRVGNVVAQASDYDASQVDNDSTVAGATVKDALETLDSKEVTTSDVTTLTDVSYTYDDTLKHKLSMMLSSGCETTDFPITDNNDGTVDIGAGSAHTRVSDSEEADIISYTINSTTVINNFPDNDTSYVYVEYNGGSPQIGHGVDPTILFFRKDISIMYAITRLGTDLKILDVKGQTIDYIHRATLQAALIEGVQKVGGGAITVNGNNTIAITDGQWLILNRIVNTLGINSDAPDNTTFKIGYQDGLGGWTRTPATVLPFDNWDDGTGTLANLGNNEWNNLWVSVIHGAVGEYLVTVGQTAYTTLQEAIDAPFMDTRPPEVNRFSTGDELYKIVYRGNGTLEAIIDVKASEFGNVLAAGNHNELGGLQGGTASEYYHLTAAEHTQVQGLGALSQLDSVGTNEIDSDSVTNAELSNMSQDTIKGRSSGSGTGDPQDLTAAQVRAIINVEDGATATNVLSDLSDVVLSGAAQGDVLYYNGTNWVNLAAGTSGQVLSTNGAGANPSWINQSVGSAPTLNKTFTRKDPTASDDITIFRTDVAITVQEVVAVSTGTSPSTTYQLKHSTDRSAAGNNLTTSAATTSTTTGDTATLSDATIPANSWIWIETTAATGTDVILSVDIRYTED